MSPTGSDAWALELSTAARARLAEDVLAWGQPRPPAPPGLASRLLAQLEEGLRPWRDALVDLAARSRGRRVLLSKSRLDRLACDGWQLDPVPYAHTWANARGVLAHEAIAADVVRGRDLDPATLVGRVWGEVASRRPGDPASLSAWMNARPGEEVGRLCGEIAALVATFREVWPPLPAHLVVSRVERPVEVRLASRTVALRGVPDLVLDSRVADDRARALVVDLKTGRPRSEHDRHELRFYALLVTLATGRPPFRWATFYVTEGRTEVEDLREATLEATVQRVVDTAAQLVRVQPPDGPPPEASLRLTAGSWCRFCARLDTCAVARQAGVSEPGASAPERE